MSIKKIKLLIGPDWNPSWAPGKTFSILFQLLCAILLIPILYSCVYVQPSGADDYPDATWTSFTDSFLHYYNTNGGRYFSLIVLMLNPLHWHSMIGYQMACAVLLVAFCWCFYRLISVAIAKYTTAPSYIGGLIGAFAILIIITNMNGLAQNFFWFTGAAVYTLSAILMSLLIRVLMQVNGDVPDFKQKAYLYILCIAIIGTNELTMLLCLALCGMNWIDSRQKNQSVRSQFWGRLLLVSAAFAIIYLAAPGNYQRLNNQQRALGMAIPNWLYTTQKFAYSWIKNPFLLGFSAVVVALTQKYPLRKPAMNLLPAFLLPFGIMYLFFLPVNIILGHLYYARVTNLIYIFFVLGWIIFLFHFSYYIRQFLQAQEFRGPILKQLMLVGTLATLLICINNHDLRANNLFAIYKGLVRGIPQHYSAELNARYIRLQTSGDSIVVPCLTTKNENPVYFLDISTDAKSEQNLGYARYWGKKSVAVAGDASLDTAARQK